MAIDNLETLRDRHLDCMLELALSARRADEGEWSEDDEAICRRAWDSFADRWQAAQRQRRQAGRRAVRMRALRVAAVLILALAVAAPIALAASAGLRARVLRLLLEHTPNYVEVSLVEEPGTRCEAPAAWRGRWYPGYIPERFGPPEIDRATGRSACFKCEGGILGFLELDEYAESNVNTEGAEIGMERVNGFDTMFATWPDSIIAVWSAGDRYFIMDIYDKRGADAREFRKIVAGVTRVAYRASDDLEVEGEE